MTAFLVEDGSGLPLATSYVSVTEADAYITDLPSWLRAHWAQWTTTSEKEAILIVASRAMDTLVRWRGTRISQEQGLGWPRAGAFDCDNLPIDSDVVPSQVSDAAIEFALFYSNPETGPQKVADNQGLQNATIDVLAFTWFESHNASHLLQMPVNAHDLLCGLANLAKPGRMRFMPINKV